VERVDVVGEEADGIIGESGEREVGIAGVCGVGDVGWGWWVGGGAGGVGVGGMLGGDNGVWRGLGRGKQRHVGGSIRCSVW
jgi:hypothetical protein